MQRSLLDLSFALKSDEKNKNDRRLCSNQNPTSGASDAGLTKIQCQGHPSFRPDGLSFKPLCPQFSVRRSKRCGSIFTAMYGVPRNRPPVSLNHTHARKHYQNYTRFQLFQFHRSRGRRDTSTHQRCSNNFTTYHGWAPQGPGRIVDLRTPPFPNNSSAWLLPPARYSHRCERR